MRVAERKEREQAVIDSIKAYCVDRGLFYYISYSEIVLIKANTNKDRKMFAEAQRKNDMEQIKRYIDFLRKYPNYEGSRIVISGSLEEVFNYIR